MLVHHRPLWNQRPQLKRDESDKGVLKQHIVKHCRLIITIIINQVKPRVHEQKFLNLNACILCLHMLILAVLHNHGKAILLSLFPFQENSNFIPVAFKADSKLFLCGVVSGLFLEHAMKKV